MLESILGFPKCLAQHHSFEVVRVVAEEAIH